MFGGKGPITGLSARMVLPVQILESLPRDVGVNLCRRDTAVSEEHLDHSQIRPSVEHVRREGVTEHVGMEAFTDARLLCVAPYDLPQCVPGNQVIAVGLEGLGGQAARSSR